MTECQAPELQDLLPDYVAASLSDAEMARVEVHLAMCPACSEDVALLRVVRAARPRPMAMDAARVARIAAALPRPQGTAQPVAAHPPRPVLVRTTDEVAGPPSTRTHTGTQTRSRPRLWHGPTLWRMAATVTVMVAGGTSLLVARRGAESTGPGVGQVAVAESLRSPAMLAESLSAGVSGRTDAAWASQADVPVSYGDLGDYTEEELQGMLDRLDQWDGATSTDPLPGVPLVATRGGAL